jgi:LPS sulfotransferase NodH
MKNFFFSFQFTPYVILFIERDGSTYLSSLLSSHPHIEAVYERFAVLKQKKASATEQLTWARKFWTPKIINSFSARGFKTKLVDVFNIEGFSKLCLEKNVKIIHMSRENRVKAVISKINAKRLYDKSGYWNLYNEENRVPATRFEPDEVNTLLKEREALDQGLQTYVDQLSLPTIKVTYEKLMKNRDQTLHEIFNFLNVQPRPVETKTIKHTSDNLQDVILNFDELRKKYSGTMYFDMFNQSNHEDNQ